MNTDSGQIHLVEEATDRLLGRTEARPGETVEEVLARARARHAELADGEPPPGAPVPPGFRRLSAGDEVLPLRGFRLVVREVDVEAQTLLVAYERRTERGPAGKRRRRRR